MVPLPSLLKKRCEVAPHAPQILVTDARRALACLSSHFYDNPSSKMTITGITGTNSKTTTSYFTKSIFEASGNEAGADRYDSIPNREEDYSRA